MFKLISFQLATYLCFLDSWRVRFSFKSSSNRTGRPDLVDVWGLSSLTEMDPHDLCCTSTYVIPDHS